MRGRRAGIGIALLLALGLGAAAAFSRPAEPAGMRQQILRPGKVEEFWVEDFDGDGRGDLLVRRGREFRAWFAGAGGFTEPPTQTFTFHAEAVCFDIAEIDDRPNRELVFITPGGVRHYEVQTPPNATPRFVLAPEPLLDADSVFTEPDRGDLLFVDFLLDLDGDGREDLLFPQRGRFAAWRRTKPGVFEPLPTAFRFQMASDLSPAGERLQGKLRQRFWYPRVFAADFNGDGARDLALAESRMLSVYLKSGDGFPQEPNYQIPLDRALTSPFGAGSDGGDAEGRGARRRMPVLDAPLKFSDVDGDGLMDLVLTNTFGGRVELFLGQAYQRRLETPDQVLGVEGWVLITQLKKLTRGGREDLVLGRVDEMGIWDVLKIFLTKAVTAEVQIYPNAGERFAARPGYRREMTIPLNFGSTGGGFNVGYTVFLRVDGDFDGDGGSDLVMRTGAEELSFFRGQPQGVFAAEPWRTQRIPDTESVKSLDGKVADLDGDGRADLVLHYQGWKREDDFLCVLTSGK